MVQPWFPINKALGRPFLRMRLVPVVAGRVTWPRAPMPRRCIRDEQYLHHVYQASLGFFLLCPSMQMHWGPWHSPGLLPLPMGSTPDLFVIPVPMGEQLLTSTASCSFFFYLKRLKPKCSPSSIRPSSFPFSGHFIFAWKSVRSKVCFPFVLTRPYKASSKA